MGTRDSQKNHVRRLESEIPRLKLDPVNASLATEIGRLSPMEKMKLVEELWDTLAANPDQIPLPIWHEKILAEDQSAYRANPTEGSSWAEVKARITGKP